MTILILGANSDIALKVANEYAKEENDLILASRDTETLQAFASDIRIRHQVKVEVLNFDAENFDSHLKFWESIKDQVIGVIYSVGFMVEQEEGQKDFSLALKTIQANFLGAISILEKIAASMEHKKKGFIIGISSVAGNRGKAKNYIYGSSKAGFTCYLSGLRNRLQKSGVQVLTVLPGFVATKMTRGMDLPKKLTASSEQVAKDIIKAQKNSNMVLYTKGIWRWIMAIICRIPERIFVKLDL